MVTVSVIVPVYNAEKAIRRCVDSILNQEFKDLELILVDDGSKDGSPAILDEYAAKDSRVQVIHKPNSGVSATRNLALSKAQGKYVQFLDADDWIPDNSTKLMVREAEEKNVDLVVGDFYRVVGENVARKGSIETNKVLTRNEFAELMMESPADYYYGVLWNKLYRNSIIQENFVRMDEELSFCEDFIFNLEYYLFVKSVSALQVPVYYYVKTEGSLVSKSLSLTKIVNMKSNVFTYYNDFYKNIFDEKDYRKNRIAIASFLIDAAKDDAAIPLLPGTKKLGSEGVQVFFKGEDSTIVSALYYLNKGYEKILNAIALKYGIDLKDAKLLAGIYEIGTTNSLSEIADYSGFNEMSVTSMMPKLTMKGYVSIKYGEGKVTVSLGKNTEELQKDLKLAIADLKSVAGQGMSDEEKKNFDHSLEMATNNLKNYVKTNDE